VRVCNSQNVEQKPSNNVYPNYVAAIAHGSSNNVIDTHNSDDVVTASIDTNLSLYRFESVMIVILGKVNISDLRALIKKRFGDWAPSAPHDLPAAVPDLPT